MFYELISPTGVIRNVWADGVKVFNGQTCLYEYSKSERDDFEERHERYNKEICVATVPSTWALIGFEEEVNQKIYLLNFEFPFIINHDDYFKNMEFNKRFSGKF